MKKWLLLAYGLACYASFLAVALYMAGWLGNLVVPRSIDAARSTDFLQAVWIDGMLIAAFAIQHSLMARPRFKRWWTQYIPRPAERSTYVLTTNVVLAILFWQWRPLGGEIWDLQQPMLRWAIHVLYVVGWLIVVGSTFSLNHFDLFGLRQVWLAFTGQPYRPLPFRVPGPYRFVRHPLYVGWLVVFWSTPTMTVTHLFFAAGMTAYILIAIPIEERDLLAHHGSLYREYQQRVGRLVPRPNRSAASSQVTNSKAEESACSVAASE